MPIGSVEGGLEEFVELSLSRASRSRTLASRSEIRCCIARNTAAIAAWASGGTLSQSSSGIGSGFDTTPIYAVIKFRQSQGVNDYRLRPNEIRAYVDLFGGTAAGNLFHRSNASRSS